MSKRSAPTLRFVMHDDDLGRVVVDVEPFFDFSFWLAESLQDLVAQHRAWWAPRRRRDLLRKNPPR